MSNPELRKIYYLDPTTAKRILTLYNHYNPYTPTERVDAQVLRFVLRHVFKDFCDWFYSYNPPKVSVKQERFYKTINLTLSEDEVKSLDSVANFYGISHGTFLKLLVGNSYLEYLNTIK